MELSDLETDTGKIIPRINGLAIYLGGHNSRSELQPGDVIDLGPWTSQ